MFTLVLMEIIRTSGTLTLEITLLLKPIIATSLMLLFTREDLGEATFTSAPGDRVAGW